MSCSPDQPLHRLSPGDIVERALGGDRRVLLVGAPGTGKSTCAAGLAAALHATGRDCWQLDADPGSPHLGLPGAVCLGQWHDGAWQLAAFEALCTLNAGRFRLPLTQAARRLARSVKKGVLLIDSPGVVRGVAGAELLGALKEAVDADLVLALQHGDGEPPLAAELQALGIEVLNLLAAAGAHRPGKRLRARHRTRLWDDWLTEAVTQHVDLDSVSLTGTVPPGDVPLSWSGRQVALLTAGRTVALGEIMAMSGRSLQIRAPGLPVEADTLLIRDAIRSGDGYLNTATPFAQTARPRQSPPDLMPRRSRTGSAGPGPVARLGVADAVLVNGVQGDPMLHLRLHHQRRSLLFDLGMPDERPSTRIAHQVTDVFISHAHIDHIGGFLWLLRARMGELAPCRLYGPAGLADHIEGLIRGIHWDRIGDNGPRFEVAELHGESLHWYRLQAGRSHRQTMNTQPVEQGIVLDEPEFRVHAVSLDHGGIPVLAYAFEPPIQIGIRKERLAARGWPTGPWLGRLKRLLLAGEYSASVQLPDGSTATAGALAPELTLTAVGKKLVYATDIADTPDNRTRLVELARGSHTLFCEAPFSQADRDQSLRTGHLTTRACGEIATAADVVQLIPFHFSRRYSGDLRPLYREIAEVCSRLVRPTGSEGRPL